MYQIPGQSLFRATTPEGGSTMKAGFFFANRDAANRVLNRVDERTANQRPPRRIPATLATAVTRLLGR